MSDLRAAVEALPGYDVTFDRDVAADLDLSKGERYVRYVAPPTTITVTTAGSTGGSISRTAVLAIIDAHQCYDEAALAEALHRVTSHYERGVNPQTDVHRRFHEADAAAIIARLHEA